MQCISVQPFQDAFDHRDSAGGLRNVASIKIVGEDSPLWVMQGLHELLQPSHEEQFQVFYLRQGKRVRG